MATIEPTEYTVYPTGYDESDEGHLVNIAHWLITLERRAPGQWAVCRRSECMDRYGAWAYESLPSSRTDRFKVTHRFPLPVAQELALKYIDSVTANGLTWSGLLDWLAREPGSPA